MAEQKDPSPKLTWTIAKGDNGRFIRRKVEGDGLNMDYIDVQWKHSTGFAPGTLRVPKTYDYDKKEITYEVRSQPVLEVIHDTVVVQPNVSDATVALMLDEKRLALAAALKVEP